MNTEKALTPEMCLSFAIQQLAYNIAQCGFGFLDVSEGRIEDNAVWVIVKDDNFNLRFSVPFALSLFYQGSRLNNTVFAESAIDFLRRRNDLINQKGL